MNPRHVVRVSRFLSLILRHDPAKVGLTLDASGWVDVSELLAALARHGRPITLDELRHVVENNDKRRFAFSPDGRNIRASQGHSLKIDLSYEPSHPPLTLYHGTAERNLSAIREKGLLKMSRSHVHLSADRDTASQVGQRYGVPIVLEVFCGKMAIEGFVFYLSANGVWLTEHVPPRFIVFPE